MNCAGEPGQSCSMCPGMAALQMLS
jgi:hypothetical protein